MRAGWRVIVQSLLIICAVTAAWAQANSDDMPVERGVPILPGSGLLLPGRQLIQPVSPALLEPAEGIVVTPPEGVAASVQFKWQPGSTTSPVTFYRVCVFEFTKTCQDSGSEFYSINGQTHMLTPQPVCPLQSF